MGCRELQPNDYFSFVGDDKPESPFPRGNREYKSIAEGFIFNAENRIVSMETADKKLEFVYDYMGRRVEKKVYTGSAGNWSLITDNCYVYDGYKQIEKLDALNSNAIAQKFVWRGERILSVNNGTDTYYYTQDANKNVSELLASDGTIKAHYEYSPFGKVTVSNGIYADDNPYRFSSEVADDETGLVYYNYRYYSPELGRWLSRDPIGELKLFDSSMKFYKLYVFVDNQPITNTDYLGLAPTSKKTKERSKRNCYACARGGGEDYIIIPSLEDEKKSPKMADIPKIPDFDAITKREPPKGCIKRQTPCPPPHTRVVRLYFWKDPSIPFGWDFHAWGKNEGDKGWETVNPPDKGKAAGTGARDQTHITDEADPDSATEEDYKIDRKVWTIIEYCCCPKDY